jgi:DNA mismatch repair protein MSH5
MFVNSDTICSLQIFEDESHPNFHMHGSANRHKEGLSLFGMTTVLYA